MIIKLVWESYDLEKLHNLIKEISEDLWLSEFLEIETTNDDSYKKELWITKDPALCIEEESIDFKDLIFEWQVPKKSELEDMFTSILGWWDTWGWCWTCSDDWGWCWTCPSK